MIAVEVRCNGRLDRAEADSPEAAVYAARVLWAEAYETWAGAFRPDVLFRGPDGAVITIERGRRP
jgi:hypothetical protein